MSDLITDKTVVCPRCGLRYQCICSLVPHLHSQVSLILLTHPNELTRETNSGKLLTQTLANCHSFIWHRIQPEAELLTKINDPDVIPLILFPNEESAELTSLLHTNNVANQSLLFIILDSTWQEAAKMIRKSTWLNGIQKVHLNTSKPSKYNLRRNQQQGHLCTCEIGIELLSILDEHQDSERLSNFFEQYLAIFKADKSGHVYIKK